MGGRGRSERTREAGRGPDKRGRNGRTGPHAARTDTGQRADGALLHDFARNVAYCARIERPRPRKRASRDRFTRSCKSEVETDQTERNIRAKIGQRKPDAAAPNAGGARIGTYNNLWSSFNSGNLREMRKGGQRFAPLLQKSIPSHLSTACIQNFKRRLPPLVTDVRHRNRRAPRAATIRSGRQPSPHRAPSRFAPSASRSLARRLPQIPRQYPLTPYTMYHIV